MPIFNVTDHGGSGDGATNDTKAIQRTIDACNHAGGGTVLVPSGKTFLTGTISLCNNLRLQVDGRLISAEAREDFPNDDLRCMIEARGCHNLAVTGFGAIDGRGKLFMSEDLVYIYRPKDPKWRPRLIGLIDCRNVTFAMSHSPMLRIGVSILRAARMW